MALKRVHTVVAVIGMALAGGAAWWWQQRAPAEGLTTVGGAATPGAAASGARGPGRPGAPAGPVAVEVGKVEVMRLSDDVSAVGSLHSSQGVMLRPEVSGRIARLGFSDGQRVKRGQLLVQLDDTLQQAQLKQAEAQASIARTNLQRSRELLSQGFISQSAVDQNVASLEVANAQVALAQAQLARMKVLAPFDATTGIRRADVGDYVKDGADIVNLENLDALEVDFSLPERYVTRVRTGQAVEVSLDALPGRTFKGRIDALDSEVDANGRALLVRARVENPGAMLRPGMFARPRVVFATRENALVVPEEALVPMGGKQYVFKVVDGPNGGKAAKRVEARLGQRLPGKVELLEGVEPDDVIVTAGQARLERGDMQAVRVIDLARPAGAGRPASGAATGGGGPAWGAVPGAGRSAAA
jgi:membrane fusion protein (multidrug efflux system)